MGKVLYVGEAFKNHLLPPPDPAGSVLTSESPDTSIPTAVWSHAEALEELLASASADSSPDGEYKKCFSKQFFHFHIFRNKQARD